MIEDIAENAFCRKCHHKELSHFNFSRIPNGKSISESLVCKEKDCKCNSFEEDTKTILVDAVDCFVVEGDGNFKIFKEMQNLLDSFPYRKIILTGANDEQFKKFSLDNMPYEVFTLKHNPEKTDPKYYEIMLERFGLSKDDVVYFEHNPEAVKSAQLVGIKSYYYDNDKKDLEALKNFLTKNLQL